MNDFYTESIEDALNRERLDELKPDTSDMYENTWRSQVWYSEAVWTAASLFVEAARRSDTFRERFMSEETEEVAVGDMSVDMQKWRSTLEKELPDMHEEIMGIGLSAFQGGKAEQTARRYIEDNL